MPKIFFVRATLVLLILVLVFGILYVAKPVLMPLAIAGVLAILFMPLCRWFENKGINKVFAAIICTILFASLVGCVAILLSSQFSNITDNFFQIKLIITHAIKNLREYLDRSFGISTDDNEQISKIPAALNISLTSLFGSLIQIILNAVLILVYMVLMLFYRAHFKNFILKLVPEAQVAKTKKIINQSVKVAQQYLLGLFMIIVMLWIMYGISFSIIGIKNALFFALLCGVLEVVPFVGNITGCTLTGLMALAQGSGINMVLAVLATYAVVQFIQFYIIAPIIMGVQVNINPLFTIVIIIAGGILWGIPGMILSLPLLAIAKTVFDNVESLKPYGYLIGQENKRTNLLQKLKDRLNRKK